MKRKPVTRTREADASLRGRELHREVAIESRAIDEQRRTVELSFSSEAEVERWFGIEVLSHDEGSIRLGRLRNGAPLLINHDRDDQVGVVESVRIDSDRVGRSVVRFGRSARAQEVFQDVIDGIRRLVSVGYRVHGTETSNRPGGVELVRVTDWEPLELSLVSIPADDSVGVGRSESVPSGRNENQQPSRIMNRTQIIAELRRRGISFDESATDDQLRALLPSESGDNQRETGERNAPNGQRSAENRDQGDRSQPNDDQNRQRTRTEVTREEPRPASESAREEARREVERDRQRISDIEAIADQVRRNGVELDTRSAVRDGVTVDAFREQAFSRLLERQQNYAPGSRNEGLSRQDRSDLGQFSITRGLSRLIQGRSLDGIELEMQQEAYSEARQAGVNLEGNFHIPGLILHYGRRDMTATGGSGGDQGGSLVATSLGSFIELLYARLVVRGLGAQTLTGLVGNIDLPKLVTGSTVANKAETTAADESSPTTGVIPLTPKRATTYVEVSQQLMIQSTPSAEQMVRNDLLTALALLMEARAISGTGVSNQPTGILATVGIGAVVGGDDGAAPDWADIVDLETAVAIDNADIGSLGYLTNPKVRGKLKKTFVDASSNAERVWDTRSADTPLNGYRAAVTTQVPSNLTKGSSSGICSAIIYGNFSDLILAQWGGISIMANPYIKDIEGLVRLTVNAYHDNVVRRAESFAAMQDALTA